MSFRDFVSNPDYRRFLEQTPPQPDAPPPASAPRWIEALLDPKQAKQAREALGLIGEPAVPALVAALSEPEFQIAQWPEYSSAPVPMKSLLGLLKELAPSESVRLSLELARHESSRVRRIVAEQALSLGRLETIPILEAFLTDADVDVRGQAAWGVWLACRDQAASDEFRQQAYDLILPRCLDNWGSTSTKPPEVLMLLDASRAARDLLDERLWAGGPWLRLDILRTCNKAGVPLPEILLRKTLDENLAVLADKAPYVPSAIVAEAVAGLAAVVGEAIRPVAESLLKHHNHRIQDAAAAALIGVAGLADPEIHVRRLYCDHDFASLSSPQQVVLCASLFGAEVGNGGLSQFFANSGGALVAETLAALGTLNHPTALAALEEAVRLVGPAAFVADRDLRLAPFEDRYDELTTAFRPLESAFYEAIPRLPTLCKLFALEHPEQFRK